MNLIDLPNHRKQHEGNIPLIGGIAMFVGFLFGAIFLANGYIQIISLSLISFIMLSIGAIDDRHEVNFFPKLFLQVLVAVFVVSILGIELKSFGNLFTDDNVTLGSASLLVTTLAIVGGTNAFNVMDGIDGLASGLALIVFSSILLIAYIGKVPDIINLSLLYLFILIPFLFFNLSSQNKVFMGDSGTLFIGIGIVWTLIICSQGQEPLIRPVTALWLYSVPLVDSIATVFMRIKNRKSPFLPDRTHIHHQLKSHYRYSNRTILLLIITVSLLMAILGILGEIYFVPEWLMFLNFICLSFGYLIYLNVLNN
ncbi:hypothetical protein K6112_04585 [Methylophilales bacterium]|nr:hypothetical protein K6112_04585 [Methylophilales bacterium]